MWSASGSREHRAARQSEASRWKDGHRRALLGAFVYVDQLVSGAMAGAATRSPLSKVYADLSGVELAIVADYVLRLRGRLLHGISELGLEAPHASVAASTSISIATQFAETALADVTSSRLRGYGEVDVEAAELVDGILADVARALRRLRTFIDRGDKRDLGRRLARLAPETSFLELSRALERIVTARGLVEYRASLESVVARLESGCFEVAVFGRVSSGKSSLLNAILGEPLLPVGVTPVSAVPTRIVWASGRGVRVQFASGATAERPIGELAQYVSEAGNPNNAKGVASVTVRLPLDTLKDGLVLVDTPGVGSLAARGARSSYEYLPRCDHGVVLIDASSSLSEEDLRLLQLLLDSGITASVLISKADLVTGENRAELVRYVEQQIGAALGIELDVDALSAVASGGSEVADWYRRRLGPMATRARSLSRTSVRRKLQAIAEGVMASLRAGQSVAQEPRASSGVEDTLLQAHGAAAEARRQALALDELSPPGRTVFLNEAARALDTPSRDKRSVSSAIRAVADGWAKRARFASLSIVEELWKRLTELLSEVASNLPHCPSIGADGLMFERVTQPVLWLGGVLASAGIDAEADSAFPIFRRHSLRRHLEQTVFPALEPALEVFRRDLARWTEQQAERLLDQFSVTVEPIRAVAHARPASRDDVEVDVAALEDLLQEPAS